MLVVAARIKAKAGEGDALADAFGEMVRWVAAHEPETATYVCSRSTDDPERFLFFERYASKQAFEAHTMSAKFLELTTRIQGFIDGAVEIETYDEIAAKI
jgi:quinol monooxygenase YgiN